MRNKAFSYFLSGSTEIILIIAMQMASSRKPAAPRNTVPEALFGFCQHVNLRDT
jgi:hypothetical protein